MAVGMNSSGRQRWLRRLLGTLVILSGSAACESVESVTQSVSSWSGSLGQSVAGYNPLGFEAIAIGRATPQIAGNNFTSSGTSGIRVNFSYDMRLAGHRDATLLGGKPTQSWLFVDRRVEISDYYLQLHRVEGGNLADFGEGESFFIDRTEMVGQMFCVGESTAEVSPLVQDYVDFIRGEGFPVPQEYLLRRFTERADREGFDHRVDMVYVEDVLRSGFTCGDLGNLALPGTEEIKQFIDSFKLRSRRSFSIVG